MTKPNLLDKVADRLAPLKGSQLFAIAEQTNISYDTILRIRDHKVDPAFSKVQTLAEHFHIVRLK
jgi:predicted transcriptional regulator